MTDIIQAQREVSPGPVISSLFSFKEMARSAQPAGIIVGTVRQGLREAEREKESLRETLWGTLIFLIVCGL